MTCTIPLMRQRWQQHRNSAPRAGIMAQQCSSVGRGWVCIYLLISSLLGQEGAWETQREKFLLCRCPTDKCGGKLVWFFMSDVSHFRLKLELSMNYGFWLNVYSLEIAGLHKWNSSWEWTHFAAFLSSKIEGKVSETAWMFWHWCLSHSTKSRSSSSEQY